MFLKSLLVASILVSWLLNSSRHSLIFMSQREYSNSTTQKFLSIFLYKYCFKNVSRATFLVIRPKIPGIEQSSDSSSPLYDLVTLMCIPGLWYLLQPMQRVNLLLNHLFYQCNSFRSGQGC